MLPILKLYGPHWSAYTRTARLTLTEKDVPYELVDIDFSSGEMPIAHFDRHPYGKVPVLQHGDFSLYETMVICRYVDTAFTGPVLQPTDARQLARMTQVIAILDNYLSAEIRMGFVYERLFKPMMKIPVDGVRAEQSHRAILNGLSTIAHLVDNQRFLIGDNLTLADLHTIPLFDYLSLTPGGIDLIHSQQLLTRWWTDIRNRSSVLNTSYDLSIFKSP